jgi:hypothetical protein
MGYGIIYRDTYWGNANESNGWGITYPFDAGGSILTADIILIKADSTNIKADATEF